jgi:polyether ionophore transport system permease protein
MSPRRALARRTLGQSRTVTAAFAVLFAIYAVANVVGYRSTYPTLADRRGLQESFATTSSLRLFYGEPHTLLTTAGYAEWRVGGFLALLAGVFGVVASVRALRSEEEAGRLELVLTGGLTHVGGYSAAVTAVAIESAVVAAAAALAMAASSIGVRGAAWMGADLAVTTWVFAAAGALACQIGSSRRAASSLASAALGIAFALRVVADTSSGYGWVRWTTPLGWAEEVRPLTAVRPAALLPGLALATALAVGAGVLAGRRDVGTGILGGRDTAEPHTALLRTPLTAALRGERSALAVWLVGTAAFAAVVGSLSGSIAGALTPSVRQQLTRLGADDIIRPEGFLAFYFSFFTLAVSVFACAQVASARHEESSSRLETLLALPLSRLRWLAGRLALAAAGGMAIALAAALGSWAGAEINGVHVSLGGMLEAGLNTLPTGLLFLGIATLLFGVVPRASTGLAYGLVALAFVWDLLAAVVDAPGWLRSLTPFHHLGLVPIRPYPVRAATVMALIGLAALGTGMAAFRQRDVTSD